MLFFGPTHAQAEHHDGNLPDSTSQVGPRNAKRDGYVDVLLRNATIPPMIARCRRPPPALLHRTFPLAPGNAERVSWWAMIRLLFVRHGQTQWNRELRYNGDTDTELTPFGQRQAAAIAARLQGRHIDAIICSDLQRAMATAQAIAATTNSTLQPDRQWREIRFGSAEGLRWGDVVARFPAAAQGWAANRPEAAMPGGESMLDVARRVQAALDAIVAAYDNRTVVIVSHGGPLRVALCLLLDTDVSHHWRFNVAPCTLSEVALYPSGGVLNLLNDACHLRER